MDKQILAILDIIGVISFAISGALVAVNKKMDYLGICLLGIITSVGGGVTRDIVIGYTPPVMFQNPRYVAIAFTVSNVVFLFLYFHVNKKSNPIYNHIFEIILFWFDTIGLASFTVEGVIMGKEHTNQGLFICTFVGVITGVGGSILRDIIGNNIPDVFKKHIYALASITGALLTNLLWNYNEVTACITGIISIILIRFFARLYHWNLPQIM